jgi:hypothetical protein
MRDAHRELYGTAAEAALRAEMRGPRPHQNWPRLCVRAVIEQTKVIIVVAHRVEGRHPRSPSWSKQSQRHNRALREVAERFVTDSARPRRLS